MWLSKIKAVISTAWLYMVAVLVVLLALAGRRNASLRAEIAKREAARAKAATDTLLERAKRSRAASAEAAKARLEAEQAAREGRRDYFDSDK